VSPESSGRVAPDRSPTLDVLRIIACVMVVVCHLSIIDGDWSLAGLSNGVMLFFALSGYLLYRPFVTGSPDLRRYAIARFLRIMPAYVVALVGVSLLTSDPTFFERPLTYLLFLQNFDTGFWYDFLGVSWTLVIEVMFYVTLPLIALVVAGRPLRLIAIAWASFIGALWAISSVPAEYSRLASSLYPFMVWTFVPGMMVALLEGRRTDAWFRRLPLVGVVLLAIGTTSPWPSVDLASAAGAFLLVGWAVTSRPSLGRFARLAPLVAAGAAISYSAYLWHVDLIRMLPPVIDVVAILAVSGVVYALVEGPAIRVGRRLGRRMAEQRTESNAQPVVAPLHASTTGDQP
jgi:peptidoglycan/LPS O-acetylase OafA/YrhL